MFLPIILPFIYGLQTDPLITEQQIQQWVQAYAPIIIHDSREKSPLSSVEAQLKLNPVLQGTCADGSRQKLSVSDSQFLSRNDVQSLIQNCPGELAIHFDRQIAPAQAISYYSVLSEGLYIKIQYWFFYAWNDTSLLGGGPAVQQCGQHEGDWEHIALRLDRRALMQAQQPQEFIQAIDDIYFSQHHRNQHAERKYFRAYAPELQFENTHLKVYPGVGSHASYPAAGDYDMMTLAGMKVADHNDGKGLRLDLAQGVLLPITRQPWFGFAGRWGAVLHDSCDPLEAVSSASNDGSYGPGHAHKISEFSQGDWFDVYRAQTQVP